METMFRNISGKHENIQIYFQENHRIEGSGTICIQHVQYRYICVCVCVVMFHQGAVPQDQATKYKERKQMLEQVMAKDSEEIVRTMEVKRLCVLSFRSYNTDFHLHQDLSQRFLECLDEVQRCVHLVITSELSAWKQKQRLFSLEDDAIRADLNNIQRWFETLAELLWRLRHLGKQVTACDCTVKHEY